MHVNPFESQLERLARTLTEQFGLKVACCGKSALTEGWRIALPSCRSRCIEIPISILPRRRILSRIVRGKGFPKRGTETRISVQHLHPTLRKCRVLP